MSFRIPFPAQFRGCLDHKNIFCAGFEGSGDEVLLHPMLAISYLSTQLVGIGQ